MEDQCVYLNRVLVDNFKIKYFILLHHYKVTININFGSLTKQEYSICLYQQIQRIDDLQLGSIFIEQQINGLSPGIYNNQILENNNKLMSESRVLQIKKIKKFKYVKEIQRTFTRKLKSCTENKLPIKSYQILCKFFQKKMKDQIEVNNEVILAQLNQTQ